MFYGADLMQSYQGVDATPSIAYFNPFEDKASLQTAVPLQSEILVVQDYYFAYINTI